MSYEPIPIPHDLQEDLAGWLEVANDSFKRFLVTNNDFDLHQVTLAMQHYQQARRNISDYRMKVVMARADAKELVTA